MTGNYAIGAGLNVPLGSLTYIAPVYSHIDPTSPGIRYDALKSISGVDVVQGLGFTEWHWQALYYEEFEDIMALCTLSPTNPTNQLTVLTLGTTDNFVRENALAHYPFEGAGYSKQQGYLKDVTIRLDRMYAAS